MAERKALATRFLINLIKPSSLPDRGIFPRALTEEWPWRK